MRSALIVGAAGQDGQLLARALATRGYRVLGVTRGIAPIPLSFECVSIAAHDSAEEVRNLLRSTRPDEIYYLAAFHHSAEDPVELTPAQLLRKSFEAHVDGLVDYLEAVRLATPSTRLFYAASSHVYGGSATEWQDEQTPFAPAGAYGISKAAGVQCCRYYRQQERVFAATGLLYNHESTLRKPSFLSRKIVLGARRAQRDSSFRLVLGDLDARVDWGYAPDYVDAMTRILQLPEADDFVVATGETHTVREFVEAAFGALQMDWRNHVEANPALLKKTSRVLCGNAGKLRTATRWVPTLNFQEMVQTLLRETNDSI